MPDLLLNDIDDSLIRELKHRATVHGVSMEEEHRRILEKALSVSESDKPSLIDFLTSPEGEVLPDVELPLTREY